MKPTILLVPGHWHTIFHAQPLLATLTNRGYSARALQQTSVGLKPPRPSFATDVSLITSSILAELDEGKDVALIMHSVAGICGAEALNQVLSDIASKNDSGSTQSKPRGRIVHVLLIAAYIFPAGVVMDAATFVGPSNPGFSISDEPGTDKLLHMADPAHRFFNDLPPSLAQPFVEALEPTYYLHQGPVVSSETWRSLPCTYLVCERDNAVAVELQEGMAAAGKGMEVVRVDLGHSAYVGHPEVVGDVLEKLIASA